MILFHVNNEMVVLNEINKFLGKISLPGSHRGNIDKDLEILFSYKEGLKSENRS